MPVYPGARIPGDGPVRPYGSVRGAVSDGRPYRDPVLPTATQQQRRILVVTKHAPILAISCSASPVDLLSAVLLESTNKLARGTLDSERSDQPGRNCIRPRGNG